MGEQSIDRSNTATLVSPVPAGNQAADEFERAVSTLPLIGPEPACGITYNTAKMEIEAILTKEHCRLG